MSRINITSGAYKARSLIANAQRSLNLILEKNPEETQAPAPFTLYPRPGLKLLARPPTSDIGRGLYQDSQGNLYAGVGEFVYYVDPNFNMQVLGNIAPSTSIWSMADDGTTIIMVDGSTAGYTIDIQSKAFAPIVDVAFYGADRVDYIRTVFALNRPGTRQFYISGSNAVTWNALDFGEKTSSADPLVTIAALNDNLWLLGSRKGEVWYFSGDVNFPFQQLPNVIIQHGLAAKYSLATTDQFLFWITQDKDGKPWIARGAADFSVTRVSTFAIENEIRQYIKWSDAVGYCYQSLGHVFYQLDFPAADKSWVLDLSNGEWAESASIDVNGVEHRTRSFLSAYVYNQNVMLDWQNGNIYAFDPDTYTDNLAPIKCLRSFPHLGSQGNLISYPGFTADMDVGQMPGLSSDPNAAISPWSAGFSAGFGPFFDQNLPQVTLRFSQDRGYTFGEGRFRSLGATGQYNLILKWDQLGTARDGVVELSWAVPAKTALNGAFLWPEPEQAET